MKEIMHYLVFYTVPQNNLEKKGFTWANIPEGIKSIMAFSIGMEVGAGGQSGSPEAETSTYRKQRELTGSEVTL